MGKFWRTVAMLVSASLIVALVLGAWGYFSSMSQRIHDLEREVKALSESRAEKSSLVHLDEKVSDLAGKYAPANIVENELNTQRTEINTLRQGSNTIFAGYNNSIGKFDTMLNSHEKEINSLRHEVCLLEKGTSKHEAFLEVLTKEGRDLKPALAELSNIRERLARVEALLSIQSKNAVGKD